MRLTQVNSSCHVLSNIEFLTVTCFCINMIQFVVHIFFVIVILCIFFSVFFSVAFSFLKFENVEHTGSFVFFYTIVVLCIFCLLRSPLGRRTDHRTAHARLARRTRRHPPPLRHPREAADPHAAQHPHAADHRSPRAARRHVGRRHRRRRRPRRHHELRGSRHRVCRCHGRSECIR